jgi:hypothetical protein
MKPKKNPHAQALGRLGGLAKSAKKAKSSRANGIISGYSRKQAKKSDTELAS